MQVFQTRNFSVRDFEEWNDRDELVLQPKFQRRSVWKDKARSYLIDTIIRGLPVPKIYMRQDVNPKTRRTRREIVDGQQRLRTVLSFLDDGFKVSASHNKDISGKFFSELREDAQKNLLSYEFVVDLLQDLPDKEVVDIFTRLNTYAITLNPQELRHANFLGEFRSLVYFLSKEYYTFWTKYSIFNEQNILRMQEAEFISELLIAMIDGIQSKQKLVIDRYYKTYEDEFTNREQVEERFCSIIDSIPEIMGDGFLESKLKSRVLFYPLFCSIFHMQYKLSGLDVPRKIIKAKDYPKVRTALESVDSLINMIESDPESEAELTRDEINAKRAEAISQLSGADQEFYRARQEHWVNRGPRTIMTKYICDLIYNSI